MTTHASTRPLPSGVYSSRPWRIHEFTENFDLEDVWALPVRGGADDFPHFVDSMMGGADRDFPAAYRFLFAVRTALGQLLGTDEDEHGLGRRVASLSDRLPADLRDRPAPEHDGGFHPLYLTDREYAAEVANRTVHGVLHLGWVEVPEVPDGYSAQMSVLVRPNGVLGEAYMAFIKPFRYLVVYPALLRTVGRRWETAQGVDRCDVSSLSR